MQAVKWVVTKLQGDRDCFFLREKNERSLAKFQGDKSASQSSMELHDPMDFRTLLQILMETSTYFVSFQDAFPSRADTQCLGQDGVPFILKSCHKEHEKDCTCTFRAVCRADKHRRKQDGLPCILKSYSISLNVAALQGRPSFPRCF